MKNTLKEVTTARATVPSPMGLPSIAGRQTSWRLARSAWRRYGSGRHLARERLTILPDVPTAKQARLDYEAGIWAGMFAPKGTPTNILDKLANNLDAALEEPAVKK